MFGQFQSHCLFAFHAVGFFKGGNIEPTVGSGLGSGSPGGIIDEPVYQVQVCAGFLYFHFVGQGGICWHKDVRLYPGTGGIGSKCAASIARRGDDEFAQPQFQRFGDCHR
ncbi:hypothetical protein SDC9_120133 [bioreactor metagenome]|uniref:Uncharacterized protein n=1 Tax=bioreactor metagenome TaxID=1076179 RepID=A0A645C7K0_9ZZZZ